MRRPAAPQPAQPAQPVKATARVVSALLIEIDGDDALLGLGSSNGIKPGLRGRIVEAGRTLGHFEVTEVFPEGSRARLSGPLSSPASSSAEAEIEIPSSD